MHHLLRKQIVLLLFLCFFCTNPLFAQKELYRRYNDDMTYYFGLTLGYNFSSLHLSKSAYFLQNDSVLSAQPGRSGGIAMGLMATARLTNHFQARINPQLIIGASKFIAYNLGSRGQGIQANQTQALPTTLVSIPLQLKFNSDRIGNFKTYLIAGLKFDTDLSSNSSARNADDLIKLKRTDYGYEAGIGFNFYLPFVTISPEIKVSNGLTNLHFRDPNFIYSSVFDKIQSRMIIFSIHFED